MIKLLFFKIVSQGLCIIIIKLIWNFFKIIILESNIIVIKEDSTIYHLYLLGLSWFIIYALAAYFISQGFLQKNKKSFQSFCYFIIKEFWQLLFQLVFAFIFSFFIVFVISFLCAKLKSFFTILEAKYIHIFIEDILSISFTIFFAHIIVLLLINHTIKKVKIKKNE